MTFRFVPLTGGEGVASWQTATPSEAHFVAANDISDNSANGLHLQHLKSGLAGAAVAALRCRREALCVDEATGEMLTRAARRYEELADSYATHIERLFRLQRRSRV